MTGFRTFAASAALFSMVGTPLAAADLGVSSQRSAYAPSAYDHERDTAERYRRWRDRDRVDAGDVIAGVAIIAGIAAIASAVEDSSKRERDRYEDRRYDDRRYDDVRYDRRDDAPRQYQSGNIDQAVNACTREIERDVRVDSVDQVSRVGEGWEVRGRLYNGSSFTCSVSGEGRIDRVDYGGAFQGSSDGYGTGEYAAEAYTDGEAAPGQLSDDVYAQARSAQGESYVPLPEQQGAQPSYPGGPLPGEEIDGDLGG
jgi:hypothetical protein